MNCCYIIYSKVIDKYYVGSCHDDLGVRIQKHNNGDYGTRFTSIAKDWELYHHIVCETYPQAVNIERHVKRMKSRTYIENLKRYPEIATKLLRKYATRSSGLSR